MRRIEDLETPAVVVDLDVLEANAMRMAAFARDAGVALRPHAKTHKCPDIGRLQIAVGARGLSLAKVGEAEVFASRGFDDLFLAYPIVGADKARRLLALSERARLAVGADSVAGAETLSGVFAAAGRRLDVLLKVDVGFHRVGVAPDKAKGVARGIAALPGLRLRGIFTHAGHGYHATTPAEVAGVGESEGAILSEVAAALRADGIAIEEVSVGSTPTARHAMRVKGVTECRPGNYIFLDASGISLGTCVADDVALRVHATVVSVPVPERAVLDAGSKTLSNDALRPQAGGFGWIVGRRSRLERLSEEHGVVGVAPGESFSVGERVVVLPNHACVVANLRDRLWGVRKGVVETEFEIEARGRVD